ncbi:MAG: glycosyltransferase [Selenomonadaceae bacterium]|nr:glycosyltransferase [Selenomonadaceae bacterium]
MANPKVSVILTSYNHAAYVAAAIESVLNQTFADFELLIVDDGSRDNSREIIKTFDDGRIKTFLYAENRGPRLAVAEAVKSARGKYIAVHHSDDLWAPDKLEKQVAFLDANKNYAACFTWVNFVDEHGNVYEPNKKDFYHKIFEQENRSRAEWLNYFFHNTNCLCHPSAMLRREIFGETHLLDTNGFWQLPDYLMWIRLCFHADIFILQERLTNFRLRRTRQENFSATTFDKNIRMELEFLFVVREFVNSFKDDKFFLEVFPEAEKFIVDGQINRNFALAQLCFDRKFVATSAFRLTGLELLKNLLSDPAAAAQIKKLYGYDEKTFLRDGGAYDVFNLVHKLDVLNAKIFINDGNEYILAAEKTISVDANRIFYGRIDFDTDAPINFLRFDPDTNFISVKINCVLINGAEQRVHSDNADKFVNGFRRFLTNDPQIFFEVVNLAGHVTFEIFGEKEENYSAILNRNISKLLKLNAELKEVNATLNAENQRLTKSDGLSDSFRQWTRLDSKDKVLSAARFFYKSLPFDDEKKVALKDKFYMTFAPLLKNTKRYKIWQMAQLAQGSPNVANFTQVGEKFFEGELFIQPGKIAIQAHIFYLDLLKEMAAYCANMPYKFDALISIIDDSAEEKVRAAFEKIANVDKCIVRVVPNRGRDVAPFLVGFGDLLPKYDFIAHIHSKKSLYTGNEQQNWRKYLFQSLLGSPERLRKIFRAFHENPRLGLVYPQPSTIMPYIACTWLSNRQVGQELLQRAGIPLPKTTYFDFPVGTMFWARSDALKKIFKLGLTIEDFPPEQKQNDGTIAHAFERSVALATNAEGMDFYEFNPADESYSTNIGGKNLWQYFGHNAEDISYVAKNEIVSFDIFDTLLMRLVAEPYHVNEIIRFKVEDLLGRDFDFPTLRIKAEENARQVKGGDVTLDDIYKSFGELTKLDAQTCKKIRELEVATEVKLILPRADVVAWFNELRDKYSKEIWLVSDMYMQTPDVKRLLEKCGVEGYDKILISCETGLRKDTAAVWENFMSNGLNVDGKLIHLGDNETSDIQLPGDRGFATYHLMSALNLFTLTPFGKILVEHLDRRKSLYAGIFLGVVLAKKFQSPFALNEERTPRTGRIVIQTFRDLGYWFYGTPLLTFILWLIQKMRADDIRRILFFARDGFFLQPLYKFVCELLKLAPLPSDYFYASRRAVTVASISELAQTADMVNLHFDGTLKLFFKVRFGIEIDDTTEISLPGKSFEIVNNAIKEHAAEILSHAATEQKNYEKYIASLGGSLDNVGVVDMGYSGTIQYHLQRLTKKLFTGYYFATNMENRFGKEAADRIRGCFAENHDYGTTTSSVYKYHLLFESILTAPDAQLQYFDAAGKPVFGEPEPGQSHFEELKEIHEGIKDFCRDVLENFGDIILRVPIDKNFVDAWVDSFLRDSFIIAPNLRGIFDFDDVYCNALHGNALDFYKQNENA